MKIVLLLMSQGLAGPFAQKRKGTILPVQFNSAMHRGNLRMRESNDGRHGERGATIVLVALAMVAIISMAALSVDVITLYLAKEEAQRSADAAALAGARVLSLSGVTGDPDNLQGNLPGAPWPKACQLATQVAQAVANQNTIGSAVANTVLVTFVYNGVTRDCSTVGARFAINPQVKVNIVRRGLPNFFSRIWTQNGSSVSATATAEAFNPSNSANVAPNGLVTVTPRCVVPWVVPNHDPINSGAPFVSLADGSIQNPGIQLDPGTATGAVVGEKFALVADCLTGNPNCKHGQGNGLIDDPPSYNKQGPGLTLDYVPAQIGGVAVAAPGCATSSAYQEAIAGCDQRTLYACGIVSGGAHADLTFNPGKVSGDSATATECRIHQALGQDILDSTGFPFRIQAGSGNPLTINGILTSSNSIVTVPIYDDVSAGQFTVDQPPVTIVGFLQVFINGVDATTGNINLTVLNVAGCSNTATSSTPTVLGSSPVPVRLITSQWLDLIPRPFLSFCASRYRISSPADNKFCQPERSGAHVSRQFHLRTEVTRARRFDLHRRGVRVHICIVAKLEWPNSF